MTAWEHPGSLAGASISWRQLARILVVRPDNLGDVVMAGPAIRALRAAAPEARITLLAAPAGAPAAPLLPGVDDVLVSSVSWQQFDEGAVTVADDRRLVTRLRQGRHDAVVILTSFAQSPWPAAMLCRLAGIGIRVAASKEFGGAALTHWVPAPPDGWHQVDRALHLLHRVGVPPADARLRLDVPDDARARMEELRRRHELGGDVPYALVLPGASCPSRRYRPARFAATAAGLAAAGLRPVVTGTAREAPLVQQVCAGVPGAVPLAGALDVGDLVALMACARVVVCNNSGGAHLADGVGTPGVVLFAGTEDVTQYAPRGTPAAVLTVPVACAPCRQLRCPFDGGCLDVAPEDVVAHAVALAALPSSPWGPGPGPLRLA